MVRGRLHRAATVIIALEGPDGAGKSTQVGEVVSWARGRGLSARVVGKWEMFDQATVPEARFLKGTSQAELRICIPEMPSPSRLFFLAWMNTMAAARARQLDDDLVVLDGYWFKHAASEIAMGCDERLVAAITHAISPVDLVVYLDVAPEEALRRKAGDLAPYECGRDPECRSERFVTHQAALRTVMLEWAHLHDWSVVVADTPEGTQQQVRDAILSNLPVRTTD